MYRFGKCIAWFLTAICFRMKASGRENIPQSGPVILVCNHISMMDVACIYAQTKRRVWFMAKKEIFENKLLGAIFAGFGAFPINRGEADVAGIRTAMKHLKDGDLLCIFPEGTRNKKREVPLLPLQDGVAMLALRCKAAIVPSWIGGHYDPIRRARIVTGKPMDLSAYADVRKPSAEDMDKLNEEIRLALLQCKAEQEALDAK